MSCPKRWWPQQQAVDSRGPQLPPAAIDTVSEKDEN